MWNEQQNLAIVQTELDDVFYPRFDELEGDPRLAHVWTPDVFKPVETNHAAYIEEVYKGSGYYTPTGEFGSIPLTTPVVKNKVTTYPLMFTNGVELSKQLFDDNLHGVWAETVRDFADMARKTQDFNGFKVFRNAATTTLVHDGAALISASHTLIGGGTASNLATGGITSDNLNTAVVLLMQQKNQAGVVMGNLPSVLLVPPANFKTAIEQSDSALIADSGQNAINVYRSAFGFKVFMSPFIGAAAGGSDSLWFILARNHGVRRLTRQGVQTALTPWQYSKNLTYFYQANFREEAYAVDWAGLVGSTG